MRLFTPKELMLGAGISRDLYNQWLFKGVIDATEKAEGPGTSSKYSMRDIVRVAIIRSLRKTGIRLNPAIKIAADVLQAIPEGDEFMEILPEESCQQCDFLRLEDGIQLAYQVVNDSRKELNKSESKPGDNKNFVKEAVISSKGDNFDVSLPIKAKYGIVYVNGYTGEVSFEDKGWQVLIRLNLVQFLVNAMGHMQKE